MGEAVPCFTFIFVDRYTSRLTSFRINVFAPFIDIFFEFWPLIAQTQRPLFFCANISWARRFIAFHLAASTFNIFILLRTKTCCERSLTCICLLTKWLLSAHCTYTCKCACVCAMHSAAWIYDKTSTNRCAVFILIDFLSDCISLFRIVIPSSFRTKKKNKNSSVPFVLITSPNRNEISRNSFMHSECGVVRACVRVCCVCVDV